MTMNAHAAVHVDGLSFYYSQRKALDSVTFDVDAAEIFAFLGPNGGGKTTLFRVLSTLVPLQSTGNAQILGHDLRTHRRQVREYMGVVFQSPSVDRKLTVEENLFQQAALYGLPRAVYRERREQLLRQMGLTDRRSDFVETLSGGLRRRVELAKSMIHSPKILLMDEPSTGLDPGARNDLWVYLQQLRDQSGVTILLTTHLLEEADKADRIAILNEGRLVAVDRPAALRADLGGDVVTIETAEPRELSKRLKDEMGFDATVVDGAVRMEHIAQTTGISQLLEAYPEAIQAIRLGKPTLEDVFIHLTGHHFWQDKEGKS